MLALRADALEHEPKIFVQSQSSGIRSLFLDPHAFFVIELTLVRVKSMRSHPHLHLSSAHPDGRCQWLRASAYPYSFGLFVEVDMTPLD